MMFLQVCAAIKRSGEFGYCFASALTYMQALCQVVSARNRYQYSIKSAELDGFWRFLGFHMTIFVS